MGWCCAISPIMCGLARSPASTCRHLQWSVMLYVFFFLSFPPFFVCGCLTEIFLFSPSWLWLNVDGTLRTSWRRVVKSVFLRWVLKKYIIIKYWFCKQHQNTEVPEDKKKLSSVFEGPNNWSWTCAAYKSVNQVNKASQLVFSFIHVFEGHSSICISLIFQKFRW